jgi:formylmethanofuran dehydrogenase subunit C
MSALTLKLKAAPDQRLDLSGVSPARLASLGQSEIENLAISSSRRDVKLGDLFAVSGTPGDTLVIEGGSSRLDGIGSELDAGTIIVEGDTGAYAGRRMKGGTLDIRGAAGPFLGSGLRGGLIKAQSAGDLVGAPRVGERFGMMGGIVVVSGDVGERAGDRMRRGAIVVKGRFGPSAGSRMMGGTLWTETGFGSGPGPLMRRGTLIGPAVDRLLPTFADAGWHDLNVLRLISRYYAEILGDLAPPPLPHRVRRIAGDLATIGKGEILLTA